MSMGIFPWVWGPVFHGRGRGAPSHYLWVDGGSMIQINFFTRSQGPPSHYWWVEGGSMGSMGEGAPVTLLVGRWFNLNFLHGRRGPHHIIGGLISRLMVTLKFFPRPRGPPSHCWWVDQSVVVGGSISRSMVTLEFF